jgi:hypothetical protein
MLRFHVEPAPVQPHRLSRNAHFRQSQFDLRCAPSGRAWSLRLVAEAVGFRGCRPGGLRPFRDGSDLCRVGFLFERLIRMIACSILASSFSWIALTSDPIRRDSATRGTRNVGVEDVTATRVSIPRRSCRHRTRVASDAGRSPHSRSKPRRRLRLRQRDPRSLRVPRRSARS